MTNPVFLKKGDGYAGCTAFDGFTVLAFPVADREARIFGATPGKQSSGTCYRAYEMRLACRTGDEAKTRRDLFLLISHGGGREVVRVPCFWDAGEMQAALLAMPERALYAVLFTIYKAAQDAAHVASTETAQRYGYAFLEGRMKKRRKGGFVRLHIETGYQPTVNGETFSPTSYKTPEEANAAAVVERDRRKLTDAKLGWIGRA